MKVKVQVLSIHSYIDHYVFCFVKDGMTSNSYKSFVHQISRKDVDHFEPGLCYPECELLVEWELKDQKPIRLRHRINLIGAREPYNFFHLNLNPAWKGSMSTQWSPQFHWKVT